MKKIIATAVAALALCQTAEADTQSDAVKALAGAYIAQQVCGIAVPDYVTKAYVELATQHQSQQDAADQTAAVILILASQFRADNDSMVKFCSQMIPIMRELQR